MAFLRPILIFPKFINLVFCFIIKNMMYFLSYLFFKTLKSRIYTLEFLKLQKFQYILLALFAINKHSAMNKKKC